MPNYSDLNTRQLYDLIFDYVALQLKGINKTDQLELLKTVADNREVGLYDRALNEAMSSHVPYIPIINTEYETPKCIRVLSDSLDGTNYGIAEVSGDEMKNRGIHSGEHIHYEKNRLPQNNDIILVEYKNQILIKNYTKKNDNIILSTSNTHCADIVLDESVKYKILGIVKLSINKI